MGTNYYLRADFCPTCGHCRKEYHIGKNSWGWVFHFHEIHGFLFELLTVKAMKTVEINKIYGIIKEKGRKWKQKN